MGKNKFLFTFFTAVGIEAALCAYLIVKIPSEPGSQFLLGLSLSRFVIFFFLFSFFLFSLSVLIFAPLAVLMKSLYQHVLKHPILSEFSRILLSTLIWIFLYAILLPQEQIPQWASFHQRLLPLLLFGLLITAQLLVVFLLPVFTNELFKISIKISEFKRLLPVAAILLTFLTLAWVISAFSGLGINPTNFWDKHGVPILFTQIISLVMLYLWLRFIARFFSNRLSPNSLHPEHPAFDISIFIILWLLAAMIWNLEPLPHNGFNPGPYPPNEQYYPYSDAAYYYSYTQWARIGEPMRMVDKPIYSSFLYFLRLFSGSEFNRLIFFQVTIFALFPGLIYLIAKKYLRRTAGFITALLIILHTRNTIAASLFHWKVSHPKMTMSEFPTGILTAAVLLFLLNALEPGKQKPKWLLLAGGAMGLLTLVRHNVWIFLPFLVFVLFISGIKRGEFPWYRSIPIFLIAMIFSILPWSWRTEQVLGTPYYFMIPFQGTVVEQRFELDQSSAPIEGHLTPEKVTSPNSAPKLASLVQASPKPQRSLENVVYEISNHLFHNLYANVFILPSAVNMYGLENTEINHPSAGIWAYVWNGRLAPCTTILLITNLFILSIGLAAAWMKKRWVGLVPFSFFLLYNFGSAFALTSGGRYIVPTQWILPLYYMLGILSTLEFVLQRNPILWLSGSTMQLTSQNKPRPTKNRLQLFLLPLLFFALGATPVLFERISPPLYSETTNTELIQRLESRNALQLSSYTAEEINTFLTNNEAGRIFIGKALYPRFLDYQDDRSLHLFKYVPKEHPALTFTLFGTQSSFVNLVLEQTPDYFPNETEVIVLGCFQEIDSGMPVPFYYLEAFGVWMLDENIPSYYQADNETVLECEQRE